MIDDNLEVSQEVFRRMNESGQTNYLHSLFLNLSVEKMAQMIDQKDCDNNLLLLFPRKTEQSFDQEEMERWHIANNIVFLFLKKHSMNLSIKTARSELSKGYIKNKEENELKADLHCPRSENIIRSLIKFNLNQSNMKQNNSNNIRALQIKTINSPKTRKSNNGSLSNSLETGIKSPKKNCVTIKWSRSSSPTPTQTNDSAFNSYDINDQNSDINNLNSPQTKDSYNSIEEDNSKKVSINLDTSIKSPKQNCVTIRWSRSSSPTTNYTYNNYFSSESENYQYYDSICYDSEDADKKKFLSSSKERARKIGLLSPNSNRNKLIELLEDKRKELSYQLFSFQITISVIEAKDLSIIDFLSQLDPYCSIQLNQSEVLRTEVIEDTKEPVWNNSFQFEVDSLDVNTYLTLEIFDSDPLGTDIKLSTLRFPLFEIMDDLTIDKWFLMESNTIFKLRPRLHLNINIDLIERNRPNSSNDQIELNQQDYDYLESDDENNDDPKQCNQLRF